MDLQDFVTQLERILRIGITIIAAYLVALWIASVWWTFRDIRARTTDIFLQVSATLLVAVFSFSAAAYSRLLRGEPGFIPLSLFIAGVFTTLHV